MHDTLLALAFVAMILTPCIVAAVGGKESSEATAPSKKKVQEPLSHSPVITIEQPTHAKVATRVRTVKVWEAQTLPVHRSLGLANR